MFKFFATVVGFLFGGALWICAPASLSPNFPIEDVHLASAGLIGTALTVLLTLSIVPAQRAADLFSSAVLRLYARDGKLLALFFLLSILTLFSLTLSTSQVFNMDASFSLAIQLTVLGGALDAVRSFYLRTLELLSPKTAMDMVVRHCLQRIKWNKQLLNFLSKIPTAKYLFSEDLKQTVWTDKLHRLNSITKKEFEAWISELEEFGHKAIERLDILTVKHIVTALSQIGIEYVKSHEDHIVLFYSQSFRGIHYEEIKSLLTPIYESIKNLCEAAIQRPNKTMTSDCINALSDMAQRFMLVVPSEEIRSADFADAPVIYLKLCIECATNASMDDILITASDELCKILLCVDQGIDTRFAQDTALSCLFHIAKISYGQPMRIASITAMQAILRAIKHDIQTNEFGYSSILELALPDVKDLVKLEVAMSRHNFLAPPFPFYCTGSDITIESLLLDVGNQIKPVDDNPPDMNPFSDFTKASELISDHFIKVFQDVDFGQTNLLRMALKSMFKCADLHLQLINTPPHGGDLYLNGIEDCLKPFIWAARHYFGKTGAFDGGQERTTGNELAKLGLKLLTLKRLDLVMECAETVAKIQENYLETDSPDFSRAAYLDIRLEILARGAEAFATEDAAQQIRSLLSKHQNQSAEYRRSLEIHMGHLDNFSNRMPHWADPEMAEGLLDRLINQNSEDET